MSIVLGSMKQRLKTNRVVVVNLKALVLWLAEEVITILTMKIVILRDHLHLVLDKKENRYRHDRV